MNNCPHCGERVEPGDAYCFECGAQLVGGVNGTNAGESANRGQTDDRARSRVQSREPRQSPPGQNSQDRPHESGGYRPERRGADTSGQVRSLTTLWVAAGLAGLAVVESLGAIVFADELVSVVEDSGVGVELSADTIVASGGIGLVVALGLAGLCGYYYRQGYVERRFFWGLIVGGGIGVFLGNAISFLILIVVGAYGLLVVVKRDRPDQRPSRP